MKKILSFILLVAILLSSLSLSFGTAYAAEENVVEFPCGLSATAYYNRATATLTVKGEGEMEFFRAERAPWWAYRDEMRYVVVEEGITRITSVAFLDCDIVRITLPSTLEKIDTDALSMTDLEEIVLPENSRLFNFGISTYLRNIPWYKNQPDGPVYLGNMLLEYKGTVPSDSTIVIKDGTYAINSYAFQKQTNLVDVVVPDSVERIGYRAFYNTAFYNSKPDYEPIYIGKNFYEYKTPWSASSTVNDVIEIPEGIVSISPAAFGGRCYYKTVILPASLEYIGEQAFQYCRKVENIQIAENSKLKTIDTLAFDSCSALTSFEIPESVETLGWSAFTNCTVLTQISIPSGVKNIGLTVFDPSSLDSFSVDEDNPYYSSDDDGILYNKNKTILYASYQKTNKETLALPEGVTEIGAQAFAVSPVKHFVLPDSVTVIGFDAFSESSVESINIPYGVKKISEYAFYRCENLKEIEIPKSVLYIDDRAFYSCSGLNKIVVSSSVKYFGADVLTNSYPTVYCYKDSHAYFYALENDFLVVVLEEPDTSELDALLEEYEKLDRNKYIEESLALLDEAVTDIDMTITVITQETVDEWALNIESAMEGLRYVPADYSVIDKALSRAELIDRTLYTKECLDALDSVISSVDKTLDISDQSVVEAYAKAINDAIDALEYKPADYSRVNAAIVEAEKLDRILYSQATLAVLDQSVDAVDFNLNITQQSIVDGFADRINSAVSALEYADVILRNEPNDVAVSATAKEIYPATVLAVDLLDPSAIENANFAVGGYIKSVQYYDINLILGGEKVQPEGTVSVKIRIPDDVKPEKCRVYHVTDDPVDPLVRFASTLDGNYIVFETDHFSEFAIIEVETYLSGVLITKTPHKLNYSLGEKLDLTGLEVTALFSDGKSGIISGYDVSSVDISSIGKKTVTVYYTFEDITKSASFEINVSAEKLSAVITNNGEEITEYNKKVAWYKGYSSQTLQLDCGIKSSENCKISWSSDNSKVLVDENGRVTNKGFFLPRRAKITVTVTDSAGNVISSDSVTVRFYKFSFQLSGIQSIINRYLLRLPE